jgi:hypothetical protein
VETHGRSSIGAAVRPVGPVAGEGGGDRSREVKKSKGPVTDGTFFLC